MEKRKLTLTPLDLILPPHHIVKLLYFPRSNPDIGSIASNLRTGLQRTFEALPILLGTVQSDNDGQRRQEGLLCVDLPWMEINEVFAVNDLTDCQDLVYTDLKREHFPMTTSERYKFCSVLYNSDGSMKTVPSPVMMAQVNFIPGGMILAVCSHHAFMDGTGTATIVGMWAAFCRGENGAKLLTESMWNRSRLMPGDGSEESGCFSILIPY